MKRALGLLMVLLAFVPALVAGPQLRNAGATLVAESQPNSSVESGENVTVRLALKNTGDAIASNVVATLQTGNGVSNAVPVSQTYGMLEPGAQSIARDFTFLCTAPSNSLLLVTLTLKDSDSGQSLGIVTNRFRVCPQTSYASTPLTVNINPFGPADIFPSVLSVSNVVGTLVSASVTLSNLSHTYPDDLDILLVSPGGAPVLLMSDAGGGIGWDHMTLTFTDDAEAMLPDNGFPSSRTVLPSNYGVPDIFPFPTPAGPYAAVLSAVNGSEAANGDWMLYIMDDSNDDGGTLWDGWSLTLRTLTVVDGPPTLTLLAGAPNQTIRFAVSGRPGYPYAIETSPDPLNYVHLESFQMPASGTRIFEYQLSAQNRFFRAATDP